MNEYSEQDIIRYLDGDMSPEEKSSFEEALKENKALREEWQQWQTVLNGLQDKDMRDSRQTIRRFEKESAASFPYLKIAAAIVFLFLAGLLIYQWKPFSYGNYFEPYPNIVQSRGTTAGALDASMHAYSRGEYEAAAAGLERLRKSDTVRFYLGNAYLFSDQPDLAESFLRQTVNDLSPFSQQAEWLLVKALLDQDKKDQAATVLQEIVSIPDHSYFSEAEELLDKIN